MKFDTRVFHFALGAEEEITEVGTVCRPVGVKLVFIFSFAEGRKFGRHGFDPYVASCGERYFVVLATDLLVEGLETLVEGWEVFLGWCPFDAVELLHNGAFAGTVSCDPGVLVVNKLEDARTCGDVAVGDCE